jgi:hypothetical protein
MEEKINRLAKIKAIGWTSLIIFGLLTLFIASKITGALIFKSFSTDLMDGAPPSYPFNEEETSQSAAIVLIGEGFLLLTFVSSWALAKLKYWGLLLYQSLTIILLFMLLGLLAYSFITKPPADPNFDEPFFRALSIYQSIEHGLFLILFSWILTRVNIYLSKKAVRMEFRQSS